MKLIRRRAAPQRTAALYERCAKIFADFPEAVNRDVPFWDAQTTLLGPARSPAYELGFYLGAESYYILWPSGGPVNQASLMRPGGAFEQHGQISAAAASLILATHTPSAPELAA